MGSGTGFRAILHYKAMPFDYEDGYLGPVGTKIKIKILPQMVANNYLEGYTKKPVFETFSYSPPLCLFTHAVLPQMQNSHPLLKKRSHNSCGRWVA